MEAGRSITSPNDVAVYGNNANQFEFLSVLDGGKENHLSLIIPGMA